MTCCPYAYVQITVPRVSRSCERFPDGFDLHLLHAGVYFFGAGAPCVRNRDSGGDGVQEETYGITVLLDPQDPLLQSERPQGFAADPVYGRAKCLPMLDSLKT